MAFDFNRGMVRICTAAAMLSGCGGSQPPISEQGARQQVQTTATHAKLSGSWMLPEAKNEPLIYISTRADPFIYVYSYQGKMVGRLVIDYGNTQGECVDRAGDVWVTNTSASQLIEYAHGGTKPLAILPDSGQQPAGCSVDPTTGNLAVTNICSAQTCGNGNVAIYTKAKGTPKAYFDPSISYYYFCAYDARGNLLVNGRKSTQKPNDHRIFYAALAEGARALKSIALPKQISRSQNLQWYRNYFAIQGWAEHETSIYHVSVAASQAKIVGATPLKHAAGSSFFVNGKAVLVLNIVGFVSFYRYPGGGFVRSFVLRPYINFPIFLVVSLPPH